MYLQSMNDSKGFKTNNIWPPPPLHAEFCAFNSNFPYFKEVQQVGELLANASKVRQLFSGIILFSAIIGPFLALVLKMIQLFFYPSCQSSNLHSVGVLLDKHQRRLQPRSHHGAGRFSSSSPSWSCWPSLSPSSTSSSPSSSFKTITRLLGSPLVMTPFKQQRMSSAGWQGSQNQQYQYCHYHHNHHQQ